MKKDEDKRFIQCNICGIKHKIDKGILTKDFIEVRKEWGYFSKKDLEIHSFNICEECYDKMIKDFKLSVTIKNKKEIL